MLAGTGRCVLVLAGVRGLVRGMVPAGAYWRLLVRVQVSGLACGTLSVDGSVCDDFPVGVGDCRKSWGIVGDYSKLAV